MNRLANETSPYLLQHAHNPVDWYPWGEEALARAKREDKPILLSIGYAACHWCHVMGRESFENEEIAALMNAEFVCIKVDREERPDLDSIYMQAVQAMTGSGGWPMTVFLTPEGVPFYGGTYFPPEDRQGLPGFPKILRAVAEAYRQRRDEVLRGANNVVTHLQRAMSATSAVSTLLTPTILDQAATGLLEQSDLTNGGFGGAPKFPQAMALEFLLRAYIRTGGPRLLQVVERTLDKMVRGGIYDQIGGGFHRYAVDARWLVPHFEKMLYDNALLSQLYLHAWQITGQPLYRRVVEETLDYVQREMTSPEGGFYASEDADSEGEEGKFYLWTKQEIIDLLGSEDGDLFSRYYGVSDGPNYEDKNVLSVPRDLDVVAHLAGVTQERLASVIERGRQCLFAARNKRVRPGRDEKAIASWNGWMLRSFAEAGRVLRRADYLQTAIRNAEFILSRMRHDGRLRRTYKDGQSKLGGYLEDYAGVANGLLALWEVTCDARWFIVARELADVLLAHFGDESSSGFLDTSDDHEVLIVRPKSLQDNATPSGNALAVDLLLHLAAYTGEPSYERPAAAALRLLADVLPRYPQAFGHWLCALDFHLAPPKEIAIIGDLEAEDTLSLLDVIYSRYLPSKVVAVGAPGSAAAEAVPLLAGRAMLEGKATAYVCQNFTCQAPVTDPYELEKQLG